MFSFISVFQPYTAYIFFGLITGDAEQELYFIRTEWTFVEDFRMYCFYFLMKYPRNRAFAYKHIITVHVPNSSAGYRGFFLYITVSFVLFTMKLKPLTFLQQPAASPEGEACDVNADTEKDTADLTAAIVISFPL